VLWPAALPQAERILADVERRFCIHELVTVCWSRAHFAENLARFYGPLLPPGVDKQAEVGEGDILVAVVSDPAPRYRLRPRTEGKELVNARVFDAKQRYRRWTGGGHLVHATNDAAEAERDLFLLFGRSLDSVAFSDCRGRPQGVRFAGDLVGADGWSSLRELFRALDVSGGYALLNPDAVGAAAILAQDPWAANILKARAVGPGRLHEVSVGGSAVPLVVSCIGDGTRPAAWQRAILRNARRRPDGLVVASSRDRFYLELHESVGAGVPPGSAVGELAATVGAPAGDYGDREFVRRTLQAFLDSLPADQPAPRTSVNRSRRSSGSASPSK
jgi:hypothetical protein